MNDAPLENVSEHKHLGITLSSNAKWSSHIQDIYSKACRRLNTMRNLKYNIDGQSLERLYIAFIRPILEYGNIIWDNCTQEESDLIESVQQAAARIVTGLRKGTPRWKLYKELGWFPSKIDVRKTNYCFFIKLFLEIFLIILLLISCHVQTLMTSMV